MSGIYLHIPFCRQACHYCDFHFSTNAERKPELIQCMAAEILLQRNYLEGERVKTIYFGGGTPSLLQLRELALLLDSIFENYGVAPDAEITLEANPDDLSVPLLRSLRSLGINRLSIGIQSFDDAILKYLNRAHDAQSAIHSVEHARTAGFQNISIDLIYAIPGLTEKGWEKNLATAVQLDPPHISAYTLTIEEKTTFGRWMKKGVLQPVHEALAATQFQMLMSTLSAAGYRQYEISNFAMAGYESQHNSSYWKNDKYLGIGPSAHSYNGSSRQYNVANNYVYMRSVRQGKIPFEREILKKNDHINEYIFTGLRTDNGCSLATLKKKFGYDLLMAHGDYLLQLQRQRLVAIEDDHLRLTQDGRLLADRISSDLFLVD